ncbi:MAG TPA: hypothetical protein VF727_07130 [Allosphingosinicella sp.]|jgi:hypothetical protein
MDVLEEQRLRANTAALVLDWAMALEPPFRGDSKEQFADAIVAAHVVADESRLSLHRWIDAGRRAGLSWADVGEVLGISKQAAQQRFRTAGEPEEGMPQRDHEIVRMGVTAFNELRVLREEGLRGNELIGVAGFRLIFRASDRRWDYSRIVAASAGPAAERMAGDGWTYVSSWFPFHYFKRPIESA